MKGEYLHTRYLRYEQPPRLLGHTQTHGQADDQVKNEQQQIGEPSMKREK